MTRKSLDAIARRNTAIIQSLYEDYMKKFSSREYDGALAIIRKARKISAAPEIARAEALCLTRMAKYDKAYALAKTLPADQLGVNYLDLMSELCGHLKRIDEAIHYGELALKRKDQEAAAEPRYAIPAGGPPPFNTSDKTRNIIAYTLFGHSPRYCESSVHNCQTAARIFPHWTCRFYCDETVPENIRQRLRDNGGQIVMVDAQTRERCHPLMWRFLVNDDPTVTRYLIRDADSLLGERELATVEAWIASDKWFHLIRDWYTHSELLLAGLWDGCTGVIPNMADEIDRFIKAGDFAMSHIDQHFLRKRIWPTVKQSLLSHDSHFAFFSNEPFPNGLGLPAQEDHHVGANMGSTSMGSEIKAPDGAIIRWTLLDENGREICSYNSVVRNKQWRENIPASYSEKVRDGLWTVRTELEPAPAA